MVDAGLQQDKHQEQQNGSKRGATIMENVKMNKISERALNTNVIAQGCNDDCVEKNVWVGKTSGNDGCVIYSTAYTPRTSTWM